MSPKRLYDHFCDIFTWYKGHITKYKENKSNGGIDIFLDNGDILTFQMDKKGGWVLKRGESNDVLKT